MAKKSARIKIGLACSKCNKQTYVTWKNKVNDNTALVMNKFCNSCRAHTEHKERKRLD